MEQTIIYRLLTEEDWSAARADARVPRRAIDEADGYFHLSAENQLIETANLHFDGMDTLFALGFAVAALEGDLKWKLAPKRGQEFPHFYGDELRVKHADRLLRLDRRPGGSFAVTGMESL